MECTVAIVGAGQAGGGCALTLRKIGYQGRILLFGAEAELPYERPSLSKEYLSGEAAELTYVARPERWVDDGIELRTDTRVVEIDRARQRLVTDKAPEGYAYDRVVIATGGEAKRLPGRDHERICYLRSAEDSRRIAALVQAGRTAVIVGAGVIGLEVAATLRKKHMHVIVVEAAASIMSRLVPLDVARWIEELHAFHGVDLRKSTSVSSMHPSEQGVDIVFSDGTQVSAELVVVGIGILPNDMLARQASLPCDGGVLVDTQFRSIADPSIYAIGDVARISGTHRDETWTNAQHSAERAALAIAAADGTAPSIPYVWSTQFGRTLQIAGRVSAGLRRLAIGEFGMLFIDDEDCAVGVAMLDGKRNFLLGRRLVTNQSRIGSEAVASGVVDLKRGAAA
jgi:3-phenylpropionate/trans-cinnamate dioxygenase ferredoxin reductase subunit